MGDSGRRILAVLLGVLLVASLAPGGVGTATAEVTGWSTVTPMTQERAFHGMTATGGYGYAVGGRSDTIDTLASVEQYDPGTDTWTSVASLTTARRDLAVTATDDAVYAIGGYNSGYLRSVERYNPSTDTWSSVASMPTARSASAAATLNGSVYVVGGRNSGGTLSVVERYNPESDSWTTVASLPTSRIGHAIAAINGSLYVMGGQTTANTVSRDNTVYRYDPGADNWTTVTGMNSVRRAHAATVVGEEIIVAGGYDGDGLQSVESYDPSTDTWSNEASMGTVRGNLGAMTIDQRPYVGGGQNSFGTYLASVERATVPSYSVSGYVTEPGGDAVEGATVRVVETGAVNTTVSDGSYGFDLVNGTYTVEASKDGYENDTATVTVNGSAVSNVNLSLVQDSDPSLILDTRTLIRHNQSHPYVVRWLVNESGTNISYTVTDNATVTSLNTTLLTVNQTSNELVATSNENLSGVVKVRAEYNGTYSYTNVTVAEPTVENLPIVPGLWRVSAVVGDDFYFFLLIAVLMAVPAARFTSAFGGLAVGEMILVVGWLGGYVSFGMAAVSVFISLFIGLNLAANINYTAGRFER